MSIMVRPVRWVNATLLKTSLKKFVGLNLRSKNILQKKIVDVNVEQLSEELSEVVFANGGKDFHLIP